MTRSEIEKMGRYWEVAEEMANGYPRTCSTGRAYGAIVVTDSNGCTRALCPYLQIWDADGFTSSRIRFKVRHVTTQGEAWRVDDISERGGVQILNEALETKGWDYKVVDRL